MYAELNYLGDYEPPAKKSRGAASATPRQDKTKVVKSQSAKQKGGLFIVFHGRVPCQGTIKVEYHVCSGVEEESGATPAAAAVSAPPQSSKG